MELLENGGSGWFLVSNKSVSDLPRNLQLTSNWDTSDVISNFNHCFENEQLLKCSEKDVTNKTTITYQIGSEYEVTRLSDGYVFIGRLVSAIAGYLTFKSSDGSEFTTNLKGCNCLLNSLY